MSEKNKEIKKGIYKHYKGSDHEVLLEAKHTETGEEFVVYKHDDQFWIRPKEMFLEEVEVDGEKKPRFEFVREAEKEDFEDKYLRALADYQNLLKRISQEKQEFAKYANEQLILEMLPVYDNLKTSLDHLSEEARANGWAKGIEYVIKQFGDALKNYGIEEIKTGGEKFDHNLMEAMEKEETEDEEKDGTVAREIMGGYRMGDKVIRAARVVVYEKNSKH